MAYLSMPTLLLAASLLISSAAGECYPQGFRKDCGFLGITQQQCVQKGCCWHEFADHSPWCFFPNGEPPQYVVKSSVTTNTGMQLTLITKNTTSGGYGADITPVMVSVDFDTNERLHIKFVDPKNDRWEVPTRFSPMPAPPTTKASSPLYIVTTAEPGKNFFVKVARKSDGEVIFDSTPASGFNGLTFSDQYLSITTQLPEGYNVYGLGEHVHPLKLTPMTYTMWNFDTATPANLNLYGSHPFYMDLRKSGSAHGVFLRNSNGMDVVLDDTSLTYKVIGGVLDFYFFMGPSPESVATQYQQVIGRPHMPPYWALGFHQCRYGYANVQALEDVVANYSSHEIPLDTMWTDIDYMDAYKDFTLSPSNFPKSEMNTFVSKLHSNGQHYVVIVDPGIANQDGYAAWDDGKQQDVFIKDKTGSIFIGKVWPGTTAFPDFFHPKSMDYWKAEISKFLDLLPVDGLWIDMNEISNFCNGACVDDDEDKDEEEKKEGDTNKRLAIGFNPTNPPYGIRNQGGSAPLNTKTLDMDCVHFGNVLEYNAHNLFGLTEAIATSNALESLKKKRSFVLSRSTFPGSGAYTGHWTGDNHANWDDLYNSIPGMLNFQLFGIPLVGSDICGFIGTTSEELCGRWMQLGAFYPFSRNHDDIHSAPQEPYRWDSVAAISKTVLAIRYSILPYYYSLFHLASKNITEGGSPVGATVTRPLFFEFPTDPNTYAIDRQFLVGGALLITPVLDQGATSVAAYFPAARWFDYYDGSEQTKTGSSVTLAAPMDHINIHVRGGFIIPRQQPALTTKAGRVTPFNLLIAMDEKHAASGFLYMDDGESIDDESSSFMSFKLTSNTTVSTLMGQVMKQDLTNGTPNLDAVTVYGVAKGPSSASLNGQSFTSFKFDSSKSVLTFSSLALPIASAFKLAWM